MTPRKTSPKRRPPPRSRITLFMPDALGEVIDEVIDELSLKTGLPLPRGEIARIGILIMARTLPAVLEDRRILSVGEIENLYEQAVLAGIKSVPKR